MACRRRSGARGEPRRTTSTTRSIASPGGFHAALRIAVDWIVTIVGAVAIVLRDQGLGRQPVPDPVLVDGADAPLRPAGARAARRASPTACSRTASSTTSATRSAATIIVFETPPAAQAKCGAGGTFVKRMIGLPGETVEVRLRRGAAYVYVNGRQLDEPYIENDRRDIGPDSGRSRCPPGTTS